MPDQYNAEDVRIVMLVLRLFRGWSQAELAEAMGISLSAVGRYESEGPANPARTLEEAALAVGLPWHLLDRLLASVAAARAAVASTADPGNRSKRLDAYSKAIFAGLLDISLSAAALVIDESLEIYAEPRDQPASPPSPEDRQAAEGLWEALSRYDLPMQTILVEESIRFRKWALCERLCAESLQEKDPTRALELADLALLIAGLIPGEESWRQRLQGYAWAHVANARQAKGDTEGAREAARVARGLWEAGAPEDPGLLSLTGLPDFASHRELLMPH